MNCFACFPWWHKESQQKQELQELSLEENGTETKKATEIWLPFELWGFLILHYLKTDDVHAFCTAFPQFYGMMHKTRHLWMIDKVLNSVGSYLTKPNILKMRLVCRRWCTGIDRTLDNISISSGRESNSHLINQFAVNCNKIFEILSLEQNSLPSRVFLARRAKLCIGQNSILNHIQVMTLITKVGIHIHHLHLDISSPMFAPLLNLLQHLFRHCLNLRSLELKETFEPGTINLPQLQNRQTLSWPFEQVITQWPKNLQYFACHLQDGSPLQCLQDLCLMKLCGAEIRDSTKQILKPAVVWRQDNNFGFDFTVKSRQTLRSVFSLKLSGMPLTHISFQHQYSVPVKDTWDTWYVFRFAEKFKNTLVHLTIEMMAATPRPLWEIDKGPYSPFIAYLNLPRLETLVLRCFPPYNLNMLFYLKSLRYLKIEFGNDNNWNQPVDWLHFIPDDIRRYLYNRQPNVHGPYLLDVWKYLPKLRVLVHENRLQSQIRTFRRDEYERHKRLCRNVECTTQKLDF